ncbi:MULTISPECIES: ABC transporter permease [Leptolyngbya]|jgi:putative ABC transport system permease protein|uniref:ABC transporter permease n=1 Tax=Leptolyngbya TaxID=47251 RepID=UPI00037C583A|nr:MULTISPECIES: ABC transporter permease [Leptolyngbya]MBD2371112.1 ABC transporter permease [Leptolyngbya sp. FACHB-161]MBD2377580.1 ABC transporter permease [Leptolyngbya sp. FACHB-238]MBD2402033.1 ABC transporter permease [Leptolyngbya sp. FACHB-239]MBD2408552.1 ABC transporter permease [Leptolyngbya sp. FACHB-402]BAS60454.1 Macrolide export ATP-binding/permease protein MacB [Leptolyngbya boryana IAM M-101]
MTLSFGDLLGTTWKSLANDLMRSGLTTLGVFMGVAAVNATLNIQTISSTQLALKLADRDQPYIVPFVQPQAETLPPELGVADQQALRQAVPLIRSISKVGRVFSIRSVQFEGQEAKEIESNSVSLNYLETTGRRMVQGRFFDRADFDQYRPVVILDQKLAATLFAGQNPIRQAVYASGNRFTVIGVTQTKSSGSEFMRSEGMIWLTEPYATAIQGGFQYSTLQISAHRLEDIKELSEKIEQVLSQRYPQARVMIIDNAKDLVREQEAQKIASTALMLVGLVALGIGGVGIANITIASVIERTKEIGIRRAVGATQFEIMMQFILEATCLSVVGGAIAIITVHGITYVATSTVFPAPYKFSFNNTVLAMSSALLVGVGASFFPALRATQVNVVQALRSE